MQAIIIRHLCHLVIAIGFAGVSFASLRCTGWPSLWALFPAVITGLVVVATTTDCLRRMLQEDVLVHTKIANPDLPAFARITGALVIALGGCWSGYLAAALAIFWLAPLAPHRPGVLESWSSVPATSLDSSHASPQRQPHSTSRVALSEPPDPTILMPWAIGLGVGFIAWLIAARALIPHKTEQHEEPVRPPLNVRAAQARAKSLLPRNDAGVPWGGILLSTAATCQHAIVIGTHRSGKTVTSRLLAQSVLSRIVRSSDQRALILDVKREWLSCLHGMMLRCPIKILNPFDVRSTAWDLAKDFTSPATARELATTLIPDGQEQYTAVATASQDLLTGIMLAFHTNCPGAWTLRDVLLATEDPGLLLQLLTRHPETQRQLDYLALQTNLRQTLATLVSRIAQYRPIAAAWDYATDRISLADWTTGAFVIVLSSDETIRQPLDTINKAICRRATELLLAQAESALRTTWFIVDDICEAGRLDGLASLLSRGVTRGCRAVLGMQNIESLSDLYGQRTAFEILGLCGNKAIFRLDSQDTAQWASSLFGATDPPPSRANLFRQDGEVCQIELPPSAKQPNVPPSQFITLPHISPSNGLVGYYISPAVGTYHTTLTTEYLNESLLPANPQEPNFVPRPSDHQFLRPWTVADLRRLRLERSPSPASSASVSSHSPASTTSDGASRSAKQSTPPGTPVPTATHGPSPLPSGTSPETLSQASHGPTRPPLRTGSQQVPETSPPEQPKAPPSPKSKRRRDTTSPPSPGANSPPAHEASPAGKRVRVRRDSLWPQTDAPETPTQ